MKMVILSKVGGNDTMARFHITTHSQYYSQVWAHNPHTFGDATIYPSYLQDKVGRKRGNSSLYFLCPIIERTREQIRKISTYEVWFTYLTVRHTH